MNELTKAEMQRLFFLHMSVVLFTIQVMSLGLRLLDNPLELIFELCFAGIFAWLVSRVYYVAPGGWHKYGSSYEEIRYRFVLHAGLRFGAVYSLVFLILHLIF